MNIRLRRNIRCTFDAQNNVLRLALKEKTEGSTPGEQLVIYAVKVSMGWPLFKDQPDMFSSSEAEFRKTSSRLSPKRLFRTSI